MFKESIAKFLKLDHLLESVTSYVETRIEILKFDLKEDLSKVLSKITVLLALLITGIFFLLFVSIATAYELSKHVGLFWAFTLVSGFYVIIGTIIFIYRDKLAKRIEVEIKVMIKQKKK